MEKFHKYLKLYEKLVKANANKVVCDNRLSEDIAQETFLKAYEHIDYLQDDMVQGWLLVVSANIAKDYVKKGGKVSADTLDPEEITGFLDSDPMFRDTNIDRAERKEAALQMLKAACGLLYEKNPKWYYIMIDSYMLGMSSAQIGKVLDLSKGAVDLMKLRARRYLNKELGEDFHTSF